MRNEAFLEANVLQVSPKVYAAIGIHIDCGKAYPIAIFPKIEPFVGDERLPRAYAVQSNGFTNKLDRLTIERLLYIEEQKPRQVVIEESSDLITDLWNLGQGLFFVRGIMEEPLLAGHYRGKEQIPYHPVMKNAEFCLLWVGIEELRDDTMFTAATMMVHENNVVRGFGCHVSSGITREITAYKYQINHIKIREKDLRQLKDSPAGLIVGNTRDRQR